MDRTRTCAPPSWLAMLPQKFSAATTSITRDCPGVAVPLAALHAVASMVSATGPAAAASHRDAWPRRVRGQRDVARPPWQRRHGRPAVARDRPAASHDRSVLPSRPCMACLIAAPAPLGLVKTIVGIILINLGQ